MTAFSTNFEKASRTFSASPWSAGSGEGGGTYAQTSPLISQRFFHSAITPFHTVSTDISSALTLVRPSSMSMAVSRSWMREITSVLAS